MMQGVKIIRKREQLTTTWSGGMTTELAIYPPGATYAQRDFSWRISTATINDEKSEFTALPGFWRILTVIDGELALVHEGYHSTTLRPFEQDEFSGGWKTTSTGTATDFNVMLAPGHVGYVTAFTIDPGAEHLLSLTKTSTKDGEFSIFYTPHHAVSLIGDMNQDTLACGDTLVVDGAQISGQCHLAFRNDNAVAAHLIHCTVRRES